MSSKIQKFPLRYAQNWIGSAEALCGVQLLALEKFICSNGIKCAMLKRLGVGFHQASLVNSVCMMKVG